LWFIGFIGGEAIVGRADTHFSVASFHCVSFYFGRSFGIGYSPTFYHRDGSIARRLLAL